jgi:Tfp pilus assembly protein PilZ
MSKEGRKVGRYFVNIPVISNGFEKNCSYIITNISTNGVHITTKKPLRIGSKICLQFTLPKIGKKITVNANTIWSNMNPKEPKNREMGLEFIGLRENDFDALLKFLDELNKP